jgi:glycosyltransferase involved in cell wall biosynthesis
MHMPASGPLVSVIIPVYNAEKFIGETLDSVFAQTWTNKEVIVVNDGSTDNTSALLAQLHHPQLTIINQQNGGASKAKQMGLERAAGDFIQYLDADDLLAPRKIELQIGPLLENPQKIAICKTAHFFDGSDYKYDNLPDDDHFFKNYLDEPLLFLLKLYGGLDLHAGMIHPNSFLIPQIIARKAGGWDASFSPCPDEDGEYFAGSY